MLTRNQAQDERAKSLASQPGGTSAGNPKPQDFDAVGQLQYDDEEDGIALKRPHWRKEDDRGLPVSPPPGLSGSDHDTIGRALFVGTLLLTAVILIALR